MQRGRKKNSNSLQFLAIIVGAVILIVAITSYFMLKQHIANQITIKTIQQLYIFQSDIIEKIETETEGIERLANLKSMAPDDTWEKQALLYLKHQPIAKTIAWVANNTAPRWVTRPDKTPLTKAEKTLFNQQIVSLTTSDPTESVINNLPENQQEFILYTPILPQTTVSGSVVGFYDTNKLINASIEQTSLKDYSIQFKNKNVVFFKRNAPEAYLEYQQNIALNAGHNHWTISISPNYHSLKNAHINVNLPIIILIVGILLAILFPIILLLLDIVKKRNMGITLRNEELKSKTLSLNMIQRITTIINEDNDFDQTIQQTLDYICESTGWPIGHAYLPSKKNSNELVASNIWSINQNIDIQEFKDITANTVFTRGQGLPGRIWSSKSPAWITDIHKDNNFPRATVCKKIDLYSAIGFPVFIDDKLKVIFEFFLTKIIESDERLLETFSIMSAQLSEASKKNQLEKEIRESEKQYRSLMKTAVDPIIILDEEGIIQSCNDATQKVLGYTPNELTGKNINLLLRESNRPEPDEQMRPFFDTGIKKSIGLTREITAMKKNGDAIYALLSVSKSETKEGQLFVLILRDITQQTIEKEKLEDLALCDYLTGLYNRAHFDQALRETAAHAKRLNNQFAILYIDLDGFKAINDAFGHHAGDTVLTQVADRLKTLLREYDIIARIGGDEFSVILVDADDENEVRTVCSRIITLLSEKYETGEKTMRLGASVGVSIFPTDTDSYNKLPVLADEALYAAKQNGKNCYVLYKDLKK